MYSTQGPRVGYRKSRNGCANCRQRRVKCDETHPVCCHCQRLKLDCRYVERRVNVPPAQPSSAPTQKALESPTLASHENEEDSQPPPSLDEDTIIVDEFPEGHRRRAIELRLLHHWMTRLIVTPSSAWRMIWLVDVPRIALQNNGLMYALLAISASQQAALNPADGDMLFARQAYWAMALREQRSMILSQRVEDAEPLSLAGLLISFNAFALLRIRDLTPYYAPTEWFDVGRGANNIYPPNTSLREGTILRAVADLTENIWSPSRVTNKAIAPDYEPLLYYRLAEENEDQSDISIYQKALVRITLFKESIERGEPPYQHLRHICMFPQLAPPGFTMFLRERRPRALVVLAHFFALAAQTCTEVLGFFGDATKTIPKREVNAIASQIPPSWKGHMMQPLDQVFGDYRQL